MNKTEFIQFMDKHNNLKEDLFIRAFLLTDKQIVDTKAFPFYGNWRVEEHCGYYFMAHKLAGMNIIEQNDSAFFLLRHAYNPFTMEIDEKIILKRIADDIAWVFNVPLLEEQENPDGVGKLWDSGEDIDGGINHGGDAPWS